MRYLLYVRYNVTYIKNINLPDKLILRIITKNNNFLFNFMLITYPVLN